MSESQSNQLNRTTPQFNMAFATAKQTIDAVSDAITSPRLLEVRYSLHVFHEVAEIAEELQTITQYLRVSECHAHLHR